MKHLLIHNNFSVLGQGEALINVRIHLTIGCHTLTSAWNLSFGMLMKQWGTLLNVRNVGIIMSFNIKVIKFTLVNKAKRKRPITASRLQSGTRTFDSSWWPHCLPYTNTGCYNQLLRRSDVCLLLCVLPRAPIGWLMVLLLNSLCCCMGIPVKIYSRVALKDKGIISPTSCWERVVLNCCSCEWLGVAIDWVTVLLFFSMLLHGNGIPSHNLVWIST